MPRPAVTIAARAARAAGHKIQRYMNRIDALHVVDKHQIDFVSVVDKMSDKEINR
jgi:myo-inositol-1(or 4)-monophosphatase